MADNFPYTPGSGRTAASDDVGGVDYPRAKIGFGADGAYSDANNTNPFPVSIRDTVFGDYETVAASATDQTLGPTGASGDFLSGVLIVPATTSPGVVSIKDGAGSAITIFTGGATSVSNLVPFFVPIGAVSTGGAWKVTTGTNVSAIGVGSFT